jgi:hypothetical protein
MWVGMWAGMWVGVEEILLRMVVRREEILLRMVVLICTSFGDKLKPYSNEKTDHMNISIRSL